MARRAHSGFEILSFHGAFHGRTYAAMSAGGMRGTKRGFGPLAPGFIHAPFCYCYRCVFDKSYPDCGIYCIDHLDWVVERESSDQLCAVITEPYQGGAGSIVPPSGYMERLQEWCRSRGLWLVFDEVQSSFGRTGAMFAFEHYDVQPDLVCLGKGLGSGVPCAAVVGRHEIMDALAPGEMSSTNGGNPLSCRAALAAIRIIQDEGLADNAARVGPEMLRRLDEMKARFEVVGDVRGQGLAIGVEVVADKASKDPAPAIAKRIIHEAFQRGLALIAPIGLYGNVIRIAPPLVITQEEAHVGLDILETALEAAA
ncbi:MAG: aspartate aminotransferase family protein, partial [Armatimonadota bacterium]